jgi:molybdopterin/thiamine biosynthesis adenylyltransferase
MAHSGRAATSRTSTRNARTFERAFLSRNWGIITSGVQKSLQKQVIFAAGVGLSSQMVLQACQIGFRDFILADGDTVEISNLNRQAFTTAHIGQNKAEATADLLRSITPQARVQVIPTFLEPSSYRLPLARATIVVNSIDFNNPTLFALNRDAGTLGIPVLFPLNLGWGSAVLVFSPTSPSFESFLGLDADAAICDQNDLGVDPVTALPPDILDRLIYRVYAQVPGGVPSYLAKLSARFARRASDGNWPGDPQLGPTTALTAAMLVRAAVALAAGEPLRVVPEVNFADLHQIMGLFPRAAEW